MRIHITGRAEAKLQAIADWVAERAPRTALVWVEGFRNAINSLANFPQRHGLARESRRFTIEVRELLYGRRLRYRALYTIQDNLIVVLTIRRAARDELPPDDPLFL